jgi:hypothetical protein
MCMGNVNMLVKCLGKPLRLENKFRKRNFNAIMDVTGKPAPWLPVVTLAPSRLPCKPAGRPEYLPYYPLKSIYRANCGA